MVTVAPRESALWSQTRWSRDGATARGTNAAPTGAAAKGATPKGAAPHAAPARPHALPAVVVPRAMTPGEPTWSRQLTRLESACSGYRAMTERLSAAVVATAAQVAQQVAHAGLVDVPLPRHYVVKRSNNICYLVKCDADGAPCFIAGGEETLVTRCNWRVRHANSTDLLEIARDLEAGWLDELATFVEHQWTPRLVCDLDPARDLPPTPLAMVEEPVRLTVADLGRRGCRSSRVRG